MAAASFDEVPFTSPRRLGWWRDVREIARRTQTFAVFALHILN
jgi:hypothetical protein